MFDKLKLMLVKDLKSSIRARWYILAVEILFILIFIPAIWYTFSRPNSNYNYDFEQSTINGFMNGGEDNNYDRIPSKLLYKKASDDIDISQISLALALMNINLFEYPYHSYGTDYYQQTYAYFKAISYDSPKLDYSVVFPTESYSQIKSEYKFDPNMFGCENFCSQSLSTQREVEQTQFYINMAFLKATNSSKFTIPLVSFVEIPPTLYKNEDYSDALNTWHVLLAVVLFIPSIFSIKDVTAEKENQIHVYMIVMGMKRYIYYISHFIFATLKMWLFLLPAGAAIAFYVKDGWWYYINLIAFGHVTVAWSMLASTLFVSGTYAMFCAVFFLGVSMLLHFLIISPYANIYVSGGALAGCLLNPFSAYSFAQTHTEIVLNYDVPFRMFNSYPYYLPMIVPLISLITQAIFYTLLTFYLDYVLPIDSSAKAHPFFFLGVKNKKEIMQHNDFDDLNKEKSKKYGEYFEIESQGLSDIEIVNLVKKWPNGEIAVKNASFKAYRGQVTALLGHNGAGKSTIFSCLTGFIKQTSGQIIIGAEAENSKIGYCPQWDPLFPLLTVEEHLYFYGNLKTSLSILKSEVDEVLEQVDLVHARRIRGNALSGGMKRKLCVGMAMVGRSRILLLDEPTAGMDPMARRGVLDIVEKVKTDKSVLLTTHYMDEADLLSDKIIIMAKGELICNGSSNFLKSKFGVGFVLTVAINTQQCSPDSYEQIAQTVIEITQRYCKDAKIDGHVTAQFKVILPNGSQRQFPHLFSELEARKHELKIDSFGVGINNLEQVFIKVTDMADPEESMGTKQKKKKESETEKSFSCMFIEKGEKIGVFELGVCTNEFSKDFFLFLCPPKSFASRLFCTQQMRCYRYWLIMKRSIPVAQGYTFETIEFDKNAHRYEVIFKIDEENFPSLTVKPICIDEIKLLLGVFDEYDLKIPIIAFCDNFSVICYSKNGGNYKFMDEWGGMHGNQLFINFDKKKTRFGTNAVTTPKTKMNTVVYDLIKIISMPADNIQVNEEWKFTFTKDNDHLVLIEFDSFDGTKKAASPTFLMAMLLKEHIKIIKNETVDKPDSLGFCVLNEFTEAEKRRVEEGLKEACKLLKIDTSFFII